MALGTSLYAIYSFPQWGSAQKGTAVSSELTGPLSTEEPGRVVLGPGTCAIFTRPSRGHFLPIYVAGAHLLQSPRAQGTVICRKKRIEAQEAKGINYPLGVSTVFMVLLVT